MDCHEPHPAPNEKTQPIQWTERPTGALVGANSLWPLYFNTVVAYNVQLGWSMRFAKCFNPYLWLPILFGSIYN
jgi:hypothetical protein